MFYYAIWRVLMQLKRVIAAILLQESSYDNHSFVFIVFCLLGRKKIPSFILDMFFSWKYENQNDTSILRLMVVYFWTNNSEF